MARLSAQWWYLIVYIAILSILILYMQQNVQLNATKTCIISFGIIGIWRYCWWLNHVIRANMYRYIVFPKKRLKADELWLKGWRPQRLFILLTTFKEVPATTVKVLQSIIDECTELPIHLFVGVGDDADTVFIQQFFQNKAHEIMLRLVIVKQELPGKRMAISAALKAMQCAGLHATDIVMFMDGDTYLTAGCLKNCLPFFPLYKDLHALTTYETAIVNNGPLWLTKWLDMRFAQRDFTMQSYALSNKVLTLTGRMSMFRGKHLLASGFIDIIEQDKLTHWLWGEYRFLSGDDKSTWYYLLKHGAQMLYIPDATTITIENIQGSAVDRMYANLRRWSGNTLRNGARAIALGPRTVGYFIWWCLIDQRCAIWTMLIGQMTIIVLAATKSIMFLLVAIIWIAFSRLCIASLLFIHAKRIDMSFPILLYINQLVSTIVKLYILFRLPQQRWKNRDDQKTGYGQLKGASIRSMVATYLTVFYCTCCLLFVMLGLDLIAIPTFFDIKTVFY